MTVIEKLTWELIIDKRISCYVIPDEFQRLHSDVQSQVSQILGKVRWEWIHCITQYEALYLIWLDIINSDFYECFVKVSQDTRSLEDKKQAIEIALNIIQSRKFPEWFNSEHIQELPSEQLQLIIFIEQEYKSNKKSLNREKIIKLLELWFIKNEFINEFQSLMK